MEKGTIIHGPTKKQILGAAKWYQVALCLQGEPYLLQITSVTESSKLRAQPIPWSLKLTPLQMCVTARQELRALSVSRMAPWIPATFSRQLNWRNLKMLKPKASTELRGRDSSPPGQSSLLCLDTPFLHLLRISTVWTLSRCLWRKRELASPWEADLLRAGVGCWYASKNSLEGIQPRSPQQCQPGYKKEPRTRKIFPSFSIFYFSSLSPVILDF